MNTTVQAPPADDFITRWSASEGAERANLHGFVYELKETAAVMSVLGTAAGPLSIEDICRNFKQSRPPHEVAARQPAEAGARAD